jgi:hypothetical protein
MGGWVMYVMEDMKTCSQINKNRKTFENEIGTPI